MRWLLVSLLASLSTLASSTLKNCGDGTSTFSLIDQGFSPDPPAVGDNTTLWFYYQVPEGLNINDGTAEYKITLNGIPFTPTTDPLCTQVTCPLVGGTYNLTSSSIWEGGVSGKIVSRISWYDTQKTLLLCSELTVRV
jgi:hypothetical protein